MQAEAVHAQRTAVVGMAARLPGAACLYDFWPVLAGGTSQIRDVTPARWDADRFYDPDPSAAGKANSRWGGLLDRVDTFDHRFFGISAREARSMDPQQRLLLEEAWHCIEDAGLPPRRLKDRVTAVYVGVMTIDYHQNVTSPGTVTDSYACLGNYAGILANRVSHFFGWRGESFALDAACAGSLTALHRARRALLAGECDYALVAGVSLILNPWHYVSFAKSRMLSPDGQCRTFDRDANGYVPGEGVVALLLCREADALAEGARIHGLVLGSATGHVGGGGSITAPSVASQRRIIEAAARDAAVPLASVSYVEAHGTGTPLGDPIEIAALAAAFGARAGAAAVHVGSVKTNIGHLEAAAGLAGVTKLLLMMRHRAIPPVCNLAGENPLIDFAAAGFAVPRANLPWDAPVLRAGVSAFGFGGTGAHAILQAPDAAPSVATPQLPFLLSARTPQALAALWQAWRDFLAKPEAAALSPADIAATLACGRSALDCRVVIPATDHAALAAALAASPPAVTPAAPPRLLLRVAGGWSAAACAELAAALPGLAPSLARIAAGEAAAGMADLLTRLGIAPCVIDAADAPVDRVRLDRAAGVLRLPWALDACYLAALRDGLGAVDAAAVTRLAARAAALRGSNFTFRTYLDEWQRALGPHVPLAGWLDAPPSEASERRLLTLAAFAALWRLSARWQLPPPADAPGPAWAELAALLGAGLIEPAEAAGLTGGDADLAILAASVAARAVAAGGIEPGPLLAAHSAGRGARLAEPPSGCLTVSAGDRRRGEDAALHLDLSAPPVAALTGLLAALWQCGADVDWSALGIAYRPVSLPLYPFEPHRHWIPLVEAAPAPAPKPLPEPLPEPARTWRAEGVIAAHRIGGEVLLPAAAWLAATAAALGGACRLERVGIHRPTPLGGTVRAAWRAEGDGFTWSIDGARVCAGQIAPAPPLPPEAPPAAGTSCDVAAAYTALARRGYAYGPALRVITAALRDAAHFVAELASDAPAPERAIALIDGAAQAILMAAAAVPGLGENLLLPCRIAAIDIAGALPPRCRAVVPLASIQADETGFVADVRLTDPEGRVLLAARGWRFARRAHSAPAEPLTLRAPVWQAARLAPAPVRRVLLIEPPAGLPPFFPGARLARFGAVAEISGEIDAVAICVPAGLAAMLPDAAGAGRCEAALGSLLDLLRALAARPAPPRIALITQGLHAVRAGEAPGAPFPAALVGAARAAACEVPAFALASIDLPANPTAGDLGALAATDWPAGAFALREGVWHRRMLAPCAEAPPAGLPARPVIVIAGGSGGIARRLARHLAGTRQARIALLSRSADAAALADDIAAIAAAGGAAIACAADLADAGAVAAALDAVRARWGRIDLVVNAAMRLADRALAGLGAAELAVSLAPKLAGSIHLAAALAREPGARLLCFSSALAWRGNAGQANYVAGCAFQDAFMTWLAHRGQPAQSIDWGFWGESGRVANDFHRQRIRPSGLVPHGDAEALAAFDAALGRAEPVLLAARLDASWDDALAAPDARAPAENAVLDAFAAHHAFLALERAGALTPLGLGFERERIARRCVRLPSLRPLLDAALDALARHGLVALDGPLVRARAERNAVAAHAAALRATLDATGLAPVADIVEACASALPAVLDGAVPAGDLLFPGGDTARIEALLHDTPAARAADAALAAAVAASVAARPGRVRVLEAGAGTGAATRAILRALAPMADRVEYLCTDSSVALLGEARRRLAGVSPAPAFAVLDIARPTQGDDAPGRFDIVIAANMLHALAEVAPGLAHLRARLVPGGELILCEPAPSDALALTLGLRAAWWARDAARQWPGALQPPELWRALLRDGFESVRTGDVLRARRAGASVETAMPETPPAVPTDLLAVIREVVAATVETRADSIDEAARFADLGLDSLAAGEAARRLSARLGRALASHMFNDHPTPALLARHLAAGPTPTVMAPAVAAPPSVPALASGNVAAIIREVVAAAVETRAESIDETARFADLGLDSILSGEAARRLSSRLGRTLPPAVFNDHPTVAALARHLGGATPSAIDETASAQTETWAVATPGDLASLAARAAPRRAPGPGEVEVAVEAAALNFRDVMEALGRLGDTPRPLGLEFAGRVAAIGPGVASFVPGEAVVGLSVGGLARHVTAPACLLAPKPAHLSFAEAAGLPIVFLTAIAAIEEIARLGPGQSVLIHAGTGGVGLAALQVARAAGATVFATAGSEEKRAFLRRLGVACVGDSRSASFADSVRDATGGAGVDMVLNCLAGPLTDAGLALVKPGGVFVEIGKTDLRDPAEVAARYSGVRYIVYDLLGPITAAPEATGRALAALMPRFSAGGFAPLPVRAFRFAEAAEALRFLARARHIGKVVLSDAPVAQPAAPATVVPPPVAKTSGASDGFAIVGMAGRFPGAPDLAAYWRLLREGRDAVGSVPEGRWRAAEFGAVAPTAQLRAGGFLDEAECFDAAFFGIAPREAVLMDPQSRVMLETAWQALADAGLDAGMRDPARAGVFVGASASDYAQKAALLGLAPDKPTLLAQMPSTIAARIAYLLDLKGPALAVDLGCASAIAAIKLACDALAAGEVDVALAGAVAVQSTPLLAIAAAEAEILAPDGRCRAFAADAQGLGLSEGAGAVVLKRLPDALAAGDAIHAVIRGAAVSQNGATNGLTAPSVAAQVALARRVLAASGIAAESLSFIEAHGVGTKAGDAAEIAALAEWLGDRPVPVGSAKGNIGHSLAAAGMAGLLKTVLQLRHREIAPSLHLGAGRNAAFGGSGLQPLTQAAPWHADGVRRAAVNAFAINGGNGFLLVEEAPARAASAMAGPRLLVVAARDEAALQRRLADLAAWLDAGAPDFADLATALAGAPAGFAWRAVFVAADAATFRAQIEAARAGGPAGAWRIGQAPRGQAETRAVLGELVRQILAESSPSEARLLAAAQLVAEGADAAPPVQRASGALLPPYPFARTRYWLGEEPASVSAAAPASADTRLSRLRAAVASVLRMAPDAVAGDVPLPRLGLDSLLAFELRAQLMRAFGAAPEVATLLGDATLAELAAALPEVAAAPAAPALRADAAARFEPFPLTDIQLAYWLGRNEDFALGGPCHVYWEFESDAPVDVARLEAALNRVIAAQEMLRAVILPDGTQRVLREVPRYAIWVHDWRGAEKPQAELAALRARIGDERFDPARWPLFHVALSLAPGGVTRLHLGIDLLIIDVPSLVLLLGEWGRLYREPSAEPARPAIAFRDYVLHQKRADLTAAAAYWAEIAPTLPPAPRLPEMKPLDARRDWAWVRHAARLDAAAWRRFRAAARAAGVTPVAALVTALAETLAHWAAEPRFTLNLTVNDREPVHPDVARVIGDFTGTVLLGFDLGRATGFAERARASGARLARHLDHARFSGVKVLQQRSAAAGAPELMPVVFTSMLGHGAFEGPLPRLAHGLTQTPQVWLDVQAMEQDGELLVTWDAIDALFPDLLIEGMFATWHAALRRLADAANWNAPLGGWIAQAEQARRARRNATDHPMEEALLHEPFLTRALAEPQRIAVIAPDRTLTYGELLAHAAAVAAALDDAAPDRLTAVAMPKGWQQIAAAIGVLMAGGAYLPLDPELPASRLQHLLARGEARTVLTLASVAAAWPADVRRIAVDALAPAPVHAMPERRARPRDLAYVIFTSGSTGEPKGVMIEHRAALNTVRDVNARYGVGAADRVLALSSLSFDLSVYDIFGLLAAGGAIVLPRPRAQGDPAHLADLLARHGVSIWNSVPMFAQLFLEGDPPAASVAPLRLVMMSGDWIPPDLPGRLAARNPALRLVSLGGATEASIWSIAWEIGPRDPRWSSVPYGWPMRNQRFHVLDEAMNHCPDYAPGELCIAGEGLARGYWRDAARTAERFVTHPATGERLYRTGDLGRYREDGVIEFLGRRDGQVKIGGYRIELGEIEAALQRIPGVRQAAVVARGEAGARRSLAAFYVAAGASPDIAAVRASLTAALPAYMVPPEIHRLAALPLNANEKVDRKALAALSPDTVQPAAAPEPVPDAPAAPSAAELESVLLGIWRDVLDNQFLPAEAKLFEHGAHSFHAVEANARINRAIGGGCTVTDIFEFATVRGLAAGLAARAAARASIRIVTAPPVAEAPATQRRAERRRQFRAAAGVAAE